MCDLITGNLDRIFNDETSALCLDHTGITDLTTHSSIKWCLCCDDRTVCAFGNNINQLAHQANARGAATGDEITEALHLVRQATRLVRERL